MRTLVESLARLYKKESSLVTLEKLNHMLLDGKITQEEFDYITTQ